MTDGDVDHHEEIARGRSAASDAILESGASKRLIVAGPGTGKSFTFRQALERAVVDPENERGRAYLRQKPRRGSR